MKSRGSWGRWILIAAAAALAACSGGTPVGLPQDPTEGPDKKPPPNTGFVMPVTLPVPPVSFIS